MRTFVERGSRRMETLARSLAGRLTALVGKQANKTGTVAVSWWFDNYVVLHFSSVHPMSHFGSKFQTLTEISMM